ncbi:hypothetical protein DFH09DRAFT_1339767 [Mycena vulgaris]|nr:hypothetical protein DFH09DRAFT_1339767 [Mycena vulgaris]
MAAAVDLSKVEFSSPFHGDDRDAESGFLLINELKKAAIVYDAATHPKIIKIWAISLQSEAKAWWRDTTNWAGKDKDNIDDVVDAFELRWPPPSAAPKKQHEKMAEFGAVTLADEEVGRKFLDSQGAESTRHVWFIKELIKKAYAAGDTNAKNLMLPQAIARLPPRLSKAIGDSCVDIQTWDELLAKTEAVSRVRIEQVIAEEKRQKHLDERLLKIEGKAPEPAPANTSTASIERDPPSPYPYQRAYAGPRYPYVSSPGRQLPPFTPALTVTPASTPHFDPLAEVTALTSKTIKLTHENTVDGWKEFRQAERDWHDKWGADMLPTLSRPYPLQPGGSELGGAGCWKCGQEGHFGRECTAPEKDCLSPKESYWRRSNGQAQDRSPAPPRTPGTSRGRGSPHSPMARFPIPPRSPHTPSPMFRRQQPPHFRTPGDTVLMVVDEQGYYYGDVADSWPMYDPSSEWVEQAEYSSWYSGNGSGSSGI